MKINSKIFFVAFILKLNKIAQTEYDVIKFSFINSRITIHYSSDNSVIVDDNVDLIETNQHEYVLNFSGDLVNIIENEQLLNFSENDEELGNENIYLSGGQGVISKLDLFSGVMENENGERLIGLNILKTFLLMGKPIKLKG